MKNGEDRKGKIISVANMKGGVGKTTTVVSLAETLAAANSEVKVLVIDLDPQASASVAIAGDEELTRLIEENRTFDAFIEQRLIHGSRAKMLDMVHPLACGVIHAGEQLKVALLPCGPRLRTVERKLIFELAQINQNINATDTKIVQLFKKEILPLTELYDFIIFDCAPGISPVTEVAIRLSDLVLVPTIPDRLSVYGLNAFWETIWGTPTKWLPTPTSPPHILIVRMDRRVRQHSEVMDSLISGASEPDAGYVLLKAQIPTSAALVEALMKSEILSFTQKYTGAVIGGILTPLVQEVKGLCDGLGN